MSGMTNEEIVAEFENLFNPHDEEETPPESENEEETPAEEEQSAPENADEQSEGDEGAADETGGDEETQTKDNKQSKQNHAFAEMRLQNKKQNDFIRNIGKLMGFDEKASLEDIQDKVKEALLEKESKEQNVPVDILKRLEIAEAALQETNQIKLEKKVTEDLTDLIDEHNLSKEEVDQFIAYLIDNDKNPMLDSNVDIHAEYLKLHYKDMVALAVKEALDKEANRQKKVDEQASSGVPNGLSEKDQPKINSVSDLDALFNNMDL